MPPVTGASFTHALTGSRELHTLTPILVPNELFWKCLELKYYLIYNIQNLGNGKALKNKLYLNVCITLQYLK